MTNLTAWWVSSSARRLKQETFRGHHGMATSTEQQMATQIVVAWLNLLPNHMAAVPGIADPAQAGDVIGTVYKAIVKAITETSTVAEGAGTDATR
jgi:hypothetical protein